jgi:hypothetical protein
MDPNIINPHILNYINTMSYFGGLERQINTLTSQVNYLNTLPKVIEDLKTELKICDTENKLLLSQVAILEENVAKLKKSENFRKRQDKKRRRDELKKKETEEYEEEDYDNNDNEEETTKKPEEKKIDSMLDSLITNMLNNAQNSGNNGPIKGSVIIDMKTGKIVDSSFTNKNPDLTVNGSSLNPFASIFDKILGNKPKTSKPNIDNDENDGQTQNDFSNLDKYEVENINTELNHISDIIELSKKFLVLENKVNKLEKVDGLYEYDGKYYGINIDTLIKLSNPLTKLNHMIGLDKIKTQILEMIMYYIQEFEKGTSNMLHTIIEGPPGVGKTELGKIFAEIYSALGIIPSNKFKLVKRTDLIGEYVGHTAHKTQAAIDEAEGGVLFIDEAYSLGGSSEKSDSFSKECLDVLNQNLSENKKKLIVIIAGYKEQLESSFFSYNPGLKRRFPFKYTIDGYSPNEMKDIYLKKLNDIKWKINEKVNDKFLLEFFKTNKDDFPNYGGDIENFILNSKFAHSKRVFNMHPSNRKILDKDDFEKAFDRFKSNKKKKDDGFWRDLYI